MFVCLRGECNAIVSVYQDLVNPFSPSKFISINLLLTISIQNQLFCCENIGIDHTLQAIKYEKPISPKLFKRKVWMPFRRIWQHNNFRVWD